MTSACAFNRKTFYYKNRIKTFFIDTVGDEVLYFAISGSKMIKWNLWCELFGGKCCHAVENLPVINLTHDGKPICSLLLTVQPWRIQKKIHCMND